MDNPPPKPDAMHPKNFSPQGMARPMQSSEQLMSAVRRLRIIEERTNLLHRKTQVIEQNMLSNNKKVEGQVKKIDDELREMKADIADIKNTVKMMVGEVANAAKKQDVEVIRKYITLWEPLNFVTRHEVQKVVEEAIEKLQEE